MDTASPAQPSVASDARSRKAAYLAEVMVRTGDGDRAAFREVYTLTSAKLFGICLRVCGERVAAEDVLHEVYLTIWRRAADWDATRGAAITWLATIARNRSIDWRRARTIRPENTIDDGWTEIVDGGQGAEAMLIANETDMLMRQFLDALEPRAQHAIRAAFFHGLTYAELAVLEGVPLGTMKSWIRRGLARLREDFRSAEE